MTTATAVGTLAAASTVTVATISTSTSTLIIQPPLTTIFTQPASCLTDGFTVWTPSGSGTTFWRNAFSLSEADIASCYPPSFSYRQGTTTTLAQYSPGVCPSGWHAAQIVQSGTAAPATSYCCPSGFAYSKPGCFSSVTTPTTVLINSATSTAITTPFTAWDWHVQVVWAASDLDDFTPVSAPLSTSASTTVSTISSVNTVTSSGAAPVVASSTTGTSSSGTSSSTQTSSPSGLTGGAIAGIVVGVVIGILAVVGIILFFVLRKRRRNRQGVPPPYTSDTKVAPDQNGPAGASAVHGTPELPTNQAPRAEMDGGVVGATPELRSKSSAAELDGGFYGPSGQSTMTAAHADPYSPSKR